MTMKNQRLFIGTLLTCTGTVYLLDSFQLPFSNFLLQWPIILLILGIAYLVQGTIGKEQHALFSGIILCGLGVHFFAAESFLHWPTNWGIYTLILGIAFLTQKKGSFKIAVLLITISLFVLFYSNFHLWQDKLLTYINGYWPLLLIGFGSYLLIKKTW